MSDQSEAADAMSKAISTIESADYNALRDGELRTLLRAKADLRTVCRSLRGR